MKKTVKMILMNFEDILASLLFVCTLSLVVVNVITRYVLRTGIPWAEEFATGCFVWTVFIGSAACFKRRAHVGVDVVVKHLPRVPQNIMKIVVDILMTFLCGYMFYISVLYIQRSWRKPTAILGISSATFSISLPIAFLDMTVWCLIFLAVDFLSMKKTGKVLTKEEYDALGKEEK